MAKNVPLGCPGTFCQLVGLRLVNVEQGTSRCQLDVGRDLLNPHQLLHGGVLYSMADTGMGAAVYTTLEPHQSCATVEIKMVYFKAVRNGQLTCETRILHRGKNLVLLESEVFNGEVRVAAATGTYAVLASS